MVLVAKSLEFSLFIFIASNFADSFSLFPEEPHFKSLLRCDAKLESFFNKTITSSLTLLFLLLTACLHLLSPAYTAGLLWCSCCRHQYLKVCKSEAAWGNQGKNKRMHWFLQSSGLNSLILCSSATTCRADKLMLVIPCLLFSRLPVLLFP